MNAAIPVEEKIFKVREENVISQSEGRRVLSQKFRYLGATNVRKKRIQTHLSLGLR